MQVFVSNLFFIKCTTMMSNLLDTMFLNISSKPFQNDWYNKVSYMIYFNKLLKELELDRSKWKAEKENNLSFRQIKEIVVDQGVEQGTNQG